MSVDSERSESRPSRPKEQVATRLKEAGLPSDRFINVKDGGKASTDHTERDASSVTGNYGVYAGRDLVILDDDTYGDDSAIPGIDDLKETFTVSTPNGGNHRYYAVEDAAEVFESAFGVYNPVTDWGEVRVKNQYVVGPGSSNPDGNVRDEYVITNGVPIAEVSAHALVGALRASGYGKDDSSNQNAENATSDAPATPSESVDLSDEKLLEKAKNAENGDTFRRLWKGDTSLHNGDHSRADQALCNHLAFWTGNDRRRIDSLFRESGLYRGKWDRDDYRDRTIQKAIQATSDTYDPKGSAGGNTTAEPQTDASDSALVDALDSSWFDQGTNTVRVKATDDYGGDELATLFEHPSDVLEECGHQVIAKIGEVSGGGDYLENPSAWTVDVRTPDKYTHNGIGFDAMDTQELKQAALESLPTHRVAYIPKREEWYWCQESSNVWQPQGDEDLRQWLDEFFGPYYSRHVRSEVMDQLKARVRMDETTFGGGPDGQIATESGLVNLESGELAEPIQPKHHVRWRLNTEYDPEADCSRWKAFLGSVAEPADIPILQEYVGYTLLHWDLPYQKALIMFGPTDAGKSVFLDVVRELFGGNDSAATSSTSLQYLANERWGPARLVNTALNIRNDLDENTIENTGKVKEIIGGDTLDAEYKRKPVFQFNPVAKHIFAANRAPDRATDDTAFWNRWLTVVFPESVPRSEQNPDLTDELLAELPGILNWAVEGYQRLQEQGRFTNEPEPWQNRDKWERYGNSIEQWLDRYTEIDEDEFTPKRTVDDVVGAYDSYKAFARKNNLEIESDRKFTSELKRKPEIRATQQRFHGKRPRGYANLKLTDDAPMPDFGDGSDDDSSDRNAGLGSFDSDGGSE